MTLQGFLSLAMQSVVAPRDVARLLMSIRMGREALLTAFALVITLNALMLAGSQVLMPTPLPAFLSSPLVFGAIHGVMLGGLIGALTLMGWVFDGRGTFETVAVLLIWMQALRVILQAFMVLILPLSPGLGGLILTAASVIGLWMLLCFVDEAHELGNLWKSAAVLILGFVGLAFTLSLLLSLAGVTPEGML